MGDLLLGPQYNAAAERTHVMCQEIGHAFGLDDQEESGASLGTCIDYADDSTNSQHPNANEYEQLETIYNSHLDSFNSATSAMPAEMVAGDFGLASTWARVVSAAQDGRQSVYGRAFGKGNMVITYVMWGR